MALVSRRTSIGIGAVVIIAIGVFLGRDLIVPAEPAPLNLVEGDVILKGYDPVAYFTNGAPVKGSSQHRFTHDGAVYQFASAENMTLFQQDPDKFAPAYGGYCSYGVRLGMKFDIDPAAFEIVDGRLFVQLDPGTRSVWLEETDENIKIADEEWKRIEMVAPNDLSMENPS